MYIILVDFKNNGEFFLEKEFYSRQLNYKILDISNYKNEERITKLGGLKIYLKYILLAKRAIRTSNSNDVIICWNFTTSIAVGWICKILKTKRKIIALNIIAPPLKGKLENIRNILFNIVMKSENFVITVNSSELIEKYSNRFNIIQPKFKVLHDPFVSTSNLTKFKPAKNYVFCGGEAHRDWDTLFSAAMLIPEINFICIAREKYYNKSLEKPHNVDLFFDVEESVFFKIMIEASLVVIPLNSIVPAGLIILLKAADSMKPIIATNTPSIRNYIEDGYSGFLFDQSDSFLLAERIKLTYNDFQLQEKLANNLYSFLLQNHSEKSYTTRLLNIIEDIY